MENYGYALRKIAVAIFLIVFPLTSLAQSKIILYTPMVSRSVASGNSLHYNIQVVNETNNIQDIRFYLEGVPKNWNPEFLAGTNAIRKLAVKPRIWGSNSESIELTMSPPLKMRRGIYHFKIVGMTDSGLKYILPLKVDIRKEGIFKTILKTSQGNMVGYANSHFDYDTKVENKTNQKQDYSLIAVAPPGWYIQFRVSGVYTRLVSIAPNKSKSVFIRVTPKHNSQVGKYHIFIHAVSRDTYGGTTLETVIKGKFGMNLSIHKNRLINHITAGEIQKIRLHIKNTGTLPLRKINMSYFAPNGWIVKYKAKKIALLNPGESRVLNVKIKVNSNVIPGDYQLQFIANTTNIPSKASYRITVERSLKWYIIGACVILILVLSIVYLYFINKNRLI